MSELSPAVNEVPGSSENLYSNPEFYIPLGKLATINKEVATDATLGGASGWSDGVGGLKKQL
jgi:hypothetical protein